MLTRSAERDDQQGDEQGMLSRGFLYRFTRHEIASLFLYHFQVR
jgi:hypothetical protein